MTREEIDLIIAEQNKSTEEILKAITKVKADYHELCNLKDMRITELEQENANLKKRCDTLDKSLVVSTKNNIERQNIIDEYKEQIAELSKRAI